MNVSVSLPDGVSLIEHDLVDDLRSAVVPLNPLGSFIVRALQSHDIADVGDALADHFGIERSEARGYVDRLLLDLNGRMLLNLRRRRPSVGAAARSLVLDLSILLAGGGLRQPVRLRTRRRLRTTRIGWTLLDMVRGLAPFIAATAALIAVVLTVGLTLGESQLAMSIVIVLAAAAAGVVVHETGHAVALRGEPAALATSWMYAAVHHPRLPPQQARVAAAAGPASTAILGLVVVALGATLSSAALAIAGLTWVVHVVGLTNVSHDGRTLTTHTY